MKCDWKMQKGVYMADVSHHVILQVDCLSGLVTVESILLVYPSSSHKAHQELISISISTKAQVSEDKTKP